MAFRRSCGLCPAVARYRTTIDGRDLDRCRTHRLAGWIELVYPDETPPEA